MTYSKILYFLIYNMFWLIVVSSFTCCKQNLSEKKLSKNLK